MILRRFDDNGKEFRYEIDTHYSVKLLLQDGSVTTCFLLRKYFRTNDGEFKECQCDPVYVSIETLMDKFIVIDSEVDKTVDGLTDFKLNTQAKELEKALKPFFMNSTKECNNNQYDTSDLSTNNKITNLDNVDN